MEYINTSQKILKGTAAEGSAETAFYFANKMTESAETFTNSDNFISQKF